jgi:hypothetical protein
MGKSTISMAMFDSFLYVYPRVTHPKPTHNGHGPCFDPPSVRLSKAARRPMPQRHLEMLQRGAAASASLNEWPSICAETSWSFRVIFSIFKP